MSRRVSALRLPLLLAFLCVTGVGWAQHQPGDGAPLIPAPGFEIGAHGRFFVIHDDLSGLLEYTGRLDSDRLPSAHPDRAQPAVLYNSVAAGAYYRVHRNLKLGLIYKLQFGARHNEDWIEGPDDWIWRDTGARPEHVLIVDATPRFLLGFLPGEDWVFSLRNRYEVTLYSDGAERRALQSLLVRPGLTYFVMRNRRPVLNLSLQYGTYWSLNFGEESPWYRHGPYLNVLYHFSSAFAVDLSLGTQWIYWDESSEFDAAWSNNTYAVQTWRPWTIEAGVIYRLRR